MAPERKPNPYHVQLLEINSITHYPVSIADIDGSITRTQNALSLFPRSDHSHADCTNILARARFLRFQHLEQKEDLDKSILHITEAILLPTFPNSGRPSYYVVELLFFLTRALLQRSQVFGQPEDLKCTIKYLQHLHKLPLESLGMSTIDVTTKLTQALADQVRMEAGHGTQNIAEIVVLCRELLPISTDSGFPYGAFLSLKQALNGEIKRGQHIQLLDDVIECIRDAGKLCPPDSYYHFQFFLAQELFTRAVVTPSTGYFDDPIAILERIIDPNRPGECPNSILNEAPRLLAMLVYSRSAIFPNPEYSEVAISRIRALLQLSFIDEDVRLRISELLLTLLGRRVTNYDLAEGLEEQNPYYSRADSISAQILEKSGNLMYYPCAVRDKISPDEVNQRIRHLEEQLSNTSEISDRRSLLSGLSDWYETKFSRTKDISDIEESIKYGRLLLDATDATVRDRVKSLASLKRLLRIAFEHTNKTNYLDDSITLCYDILDSEKNQIHRSGAVLGLVLSLLTRWKLFHRSEDSLEAIRLFPLAVNDPYAQEAEKFKNACFWAVQARLVDHPSVLTAYKSAMSALQKSLSFSPTVSTQHARLVAMRNYMMPLDYASHRINSGQIEEAIEILEQGRSILWSEMRGLRTPATQLAEEDSHIAQRFDEINQELEALITSITPSVVSESESDGTDPFGRLVINQRKLVEERDVLVSQIQGRPGMEGFLRTPSFGALRYAASRGPVILINHCRWRSDILILSHHAPPCSIRMVIGAYDRANKLRDELVEARKHGLDSSKYQDALRSVLKGLYTLVGEPAIEMLRALGVPEQSRIWWCPTSVFCSLPLHAMGPIPSDDSSKRYFSDLYIPSYTPSLSALIESRKASTQTPDKPSLLLVAQPEDNLPGVRGEIKVIQKFGEQAQVTALVSSEATLASVVGGLRGSQFAHFACHGRLETGKPFDASFKLHGNSRLTLLDVVRSRLPDAEFAFLSCCHAAQITEASIADEALHLSAAMQYCGFRSVVGTMWEMADTDGRDLARSFYKSLFSSEESGVPYYERTAGALRVATQKLRKKKGISLERWVNFVHYGA